MKRLLNTIFLFSFAGFFGFSCKLLPALVEDSSTEPFRKLSHYPVDFSSSLASRIQKPSANVLSYLRKLDQRDYEPHILSTQERVLWKRTMRRLPKSLQRVLQKRITAIYFIKNFRTSGMTDYVYGPKKLYAFWVFDAALLQKDLPTLLSQKLQTTFWPSNKQDAWRLRVHGGKGEPALLYILLHEGAHVLDLAQRITPFLEPGLKKTQSLKKRSPLKKLVDPYWQSYRKPMPLYDFSLRKKITFYGFRNGPLLKARELPAVYQELSKSPFISLYASLSWAEDLAELYAFGVLKKKFHIEYKIELYQETSSKKKKLYYPLHFPEVQRRLQRIEDSL